MVKVSFNRDNNAVCDYGTFIDIVHEDYETLKFWPPLNSKKSTYDQLNIPNSTEAWTWKSVEY